MSAGNDNTRSTPKEHICGGIGDLRPVTEDDLEIWNLYREHLEKQIQDKFNVPTSYKLNPVQVSTQVVAGQNYFFKVQLPDQKYATVRVHHIPWRKDTHGKNEQVAVHEKLLNSPNENVGHF